MGFTVVDGKIVQIDVWPTLTASAAPSGTPSLVAGERGPNRR